MNELLFLFIALVSLTIPMVASRYGYSALNATAVFLVLATVIIASHLVPLFGLTTSAGVVLFAAIFLTTDLIAELHGHKKAFETVLMTFIAELLLVGIGFLAIQIAPIEQNVMSDAIKTLFTFLPRLLFGGLIAYFVSQSIDVYLFSLYKKWTNGKHLWLRNTGSTIISQLFDSALVVGIAFYGIVPDILALFVSTYVIKVSIAILDTPFCYLGRALARSKNRSSSGRPTG